MSYLNENEFSDNGYRNGQRGSSDNTNVMNSIDLFTGTVKLPLSLCYLEGQDGLSITIQAEYNHNNPKDYNIQNRKNPSSVLGYSWNIGLPAIVSKNRFVKQGYQRNFYLLGSGGKYPLYRNGRDKEKVCFFSVEHPNWKFYFYDDEDKNYWEIFKEDGSKYRYGGNHDSNELTVCWENWVGPSISNGAENFTSAWYLSMVESVRGNCILYEYDNITENLGDSKYTRTIRLKKIISSYQQEIVFLYSDKLKKEYQDEQQKSLQNYSEKMNSLNVIFDIQKNAYEAKKEDDDINTGNFNNVEDDLPF